MPTNKVELILEKETYLLRGILFEVHNKLGCVQKEITYGNVLEVVFKKLGIPYEREKKVPIDFEGESIGDFFLDFVLWGKIGLELKAKPMTTREDFR